MQIKLHKRQSDAYLSKATEILYGGAAGGGKSMLLRAAGIAWCCDIPGLQVYLFRRESPELFQNHMVGPTGFPALLVEFAKRKLLSISHAPPMRIKFWNGSILHLCHCQYEHDVYAYQGAEIHVLLIDELTTFSEFI